MAELLVETQVGSSLDRSIPPRAGTAAAAAASTLGLVSRGPRGCLARVLQELLGGAGNRGGYSAEGGGCASPMVCATSHVLVSGHSLSPVVVPAYARRSGRLLRKTYTSLRRKPPFGEPPPPVFESTVPHARFTRVVFCRCFVFCLLRVYALSTSCPFLFAVVRSTRIITPYLFISQRTFHTVDNTPLVRYRECEDSFDIC